MYILMDGEEKLVEHGRVEPFFFLGKVMMTSTLRLANVTLRRRLFCELVRLVGLKYGVWSWAMNVRGMFYADTKECE